mgnify:CR=1 FL=1
MAAICATSFGILLILVILVGLHEYKAVDVGNMDETKAIVQTETEQGSEEETQESQGETLPSVILEMETKGEEKTAELLIAGDVCIKQLIAESYDKDGILGVVSKELKKTMVDADICMVNQEFAFSDRGEPMEDKQYTFKISPRYTSIFTELGIDIVSLANNHTLDFGREALLDSFDALDQAGILYVGAGKDLERAKKMAVLEVNGIKIGFLAASRVIPVVEWNAGKELPGMFTTYDPTALIAEIEKGKESCDFLVVYVHWGEEYQEFPEEFQKQMARQYIDAGADAVIGSHPHVLQGLEYYKGKIIAYSLGNYIFFSKTGIGAMLKIVLKADGTQTIALEPFNSAAFPMKVLEQEKRDDFFRYMEKISFGISIDEAGVICYTQTN